MNKTLLLLLPFALAANTVFNSSFELGTDGFALEKELRPATNPEMKFIPLKLSAGAPGAGKNSLMIENPYAEYFSLFSREFKLKPSTTYRFTAKIRGAKGGDGYRFAVFKVDGKWLAYSKIFKTSDKWRNIEFEFTTETLPGNGWHHVRISPGSRNAENANTLWIDDLKIEESGAPVPPQVCAVAVPDKTLYYRGETAELKLKATNPSGAAFVQSLTVTGTDEYTGKTVFSESVAMNLAPGETKTVALASRKLDRFGGFRIKVSGKDVDVLDQFFSVIGKYEAKPVDITKDYVVAFNGGLQCQMHPQVKSPAYTVLNTSFEKRFELYSRIGCRILRDHDGGVRGVDWPSVEWERGKFDFSHLDRQMALYAKYNITLFPVIGNGFIENYKPWMSQRWPLWVNPLSERVKDDPPNAMATVRGHILLPPKNLYRNYIYQTVKHLKGRVPVYEVTNEPNLYLAPDVYVNYLKEAHAAIRSADPAAKISGFCLTSDFGAAATPWMDKCVELGGLNYVDAVGFHPYGGRELGAIRPADKYIADLRAEMKGYGKPDMPLWNTELYYLIDQQVKHNAYEEGLALPHHVAWRFLVDLGEGVVQSISVNQPLIWKRILTPNMLSGGSNYHQLVLSENGVVYNTLARLFEAAKLVKKIRHPNGVICYVFRKDGKLIAAVWQYQKKKGVHADLSAFEVMDIFGNEEAAGDKVIDLAPYYLRPGKLSDSEFVAKLEKLPIRLEQAVSAGEIARKVGNSLYVMLHNDSDKEQTGIAGITGGGLTALKPLKFTLPARAKQAFEIPVKEIKNDGKPLELMLHLNKNMFRIPLKLSVNTLVSREFKMANAEGKIAFGNGEIKLEMSVKDATDAGATGKRFPWQTDCTELFFDLAPFVIPPTHAHAYTPETFRLFITPRDAVKLHTMGAIKASDCKLDVKQTADGYSFTVAIPAKTGSALGFDVKIDDAGGAKFMETQLGIGKELYNHRCNFSIVK